MPRKEASTDLWVHDLLKQAGLELEAKGSTIKEINDALKTASKRRTGKVGYPEYVGIVKDFILVIEDKASICNHIKHNSDGLIGLETKDVTDYAVNGALFYAKHLVLNTSYKKVFAFGISGNERKHRITPIFVDDRLNVFDTLEDVESFISFNEKNLDEYYLRDVLNESSDKEKELAELLSDAKELHEHLRNYGNIKDEEKPLVVSGILLALRERDNGNFSIDSLNADSVTTDGQKIYNAIESSFKRTDLSPVTKIDKILSQFSIIKDSTKLNEKNPALGETPLKFFSKFLDEKLYKSIKYTRTSEDYLGRFYGEFMRYSGGSGQTLGIVLTPRHITELFCDLLDVKTTDRIFDPCCGTGGFLVAALHAMLSKAKSNSEKQNIRKNQLFGIELRPDMFTVATTNMILRGDGKSNLHCDDFLMKKPKQLQTDFRATVGMLNPPYSQGKNNTGMYEIAFTEHLLDSLLPNAKCAVIVPQSSMTGKTKEEQSIKESILKKHTLDGVIMLQKDTFYGIGVIPCIAVFTSGQPHPKDQVCKFINFEDDGFKVAPHIGLLETEAAKDKKQHLLDVWFDRIEAPTKFCVKTTITADDEWLHSFYYFNDEIPTDKDFEKTVGDYLTFEFSMIMQGRKYLFEDDKSPEVVKKNFQDLLESRKWKEFNLSTLFKNYHGVRLTKQNRKTGTIPLLTATEESQGVSSFIENNEMPLFSKSITVDMFGHSFYHNYECTGDDNIYFFQNNKINESLKKFIVQMINMNSSKFSYGKQFRQKFADKLKIMLPISSGGEIDHDFIESYIRGMEEQKNKEYYEFALKRIRECFSPENQITDNLDKKEWDKFKLIDIFKISSGKRLTVSNMQTGNRPFIGASDSNNGITNFVSNNNNSLDRNVLGVNYNGSVVENFYHPYECIFSDDVKKFHLKHWPDNKYSLLFMKVNILQQKNKFLYAYKFNEKRMKAQNIMLPINSSGNPDYEYMEKYIKKIMYKKYMEYLAFKNQKHTELRIKLEFGVKNVAEE